MFAKAIQKAEVFTQPVVCSLRLFSGEVRHSCAAHVIVNSEGWMITAAHIFHPLIAEQNHKKEIKNYEAQIDRINSDPNLNHRQKKKTINTLKTNPEWITKISYWWGADGITVPEFSYDLVRDLAVGKLVGFPGLPFYPVFKNQTDFRYGTSLCKLGFPFHQIQGVYDEKTAGFVLAPGAVPIPRFPLDGIHTRIVIIQHEELNRHAKFIETSSPGLKGQSGGPIFDVKGNIWGIQSSTTHLDLGFSPKVMRQNKEVEENQFINVGLGAHVEEVIAFLKEKGISHDISSD